ncbi:MAG: hypothetical protein AAFP97_03865, partial [Pseudomonadota bacterium]
HPLRTIQLIINAAQRVEGSGRPDMEQLLMIADAEIANVQVMWHPRLSDTLSEATPPEAFILAAEHVDAPLHVLEYEPDDYSDRIHLNDHGQTRMAIQLARILAGPNRDTAWLDMTGD